MGEFPGFLSDEEMYGAPLPGADPGGAFLRALRERGMSMRDVDPATEWKALGANALDLGGFTSAIAPRWIGDPLTEAANAGSGEAQAIGTTLAPLGLLGKIGPKAAGLGAFGWGMLSSSDVGEAAKKKGKGDPRPATQEVLTDPLYDVIAKTGDPALQAKYELMKQREAEARASVQGVNKESADAVRMRASEDAGKLRGEIMETLAELNPQPSTFRQRFGSIADSMPLVQGASGLAAGALLGNLGKIKSARLSGPWEKALSDFDRYMYGSGFLGKANPERAAATARKIGEFASAASNKGRMSKAIEGAGKMAGAATPALGGGFVGAEVGAIPHLYNRQNAPRDSEDYKRAQDFFDDPISGSGMNAAIGAIGGMTGAKLFPFAKGPTPEATLQSRSADALGRLEGSVPNLDAFTMRGPNPQSPTGPVKPPGEPKPRLPKSKREAHVNKVIDEAVGIVSNKPRPPKGMSAEVANRMRSRAAKAVEALDRNSPNMTPGQKRDLLRQMHASGVLKLGAAGVPASAVLDDMLSRMEPDSEY